jgi:hypothetical protein
LVYEDFLIAQGIGRIAPTWINVIRPIPYFFARSKAIDSLNKLSCKIDYQAKNILAITMEKQFACGRLDYYWQNAGAIQKFF